jgi:hypothetical protein
MAPTRRNFNLAAERAALIRSLKNAETNWYAMCRDFRDAGQYWLNIKTELQERKIGAGKWASENAPVSKRWLDKYAEFAARWDEFPGMLEVVAAPELRTGTAPRLVGLFRPDGCQEAV